MSKLPRREVAAALAKLGYELDRQRGSHIILRNPRPPHRRIVVPDNREIAKGILRAIIREAGITVEEFQQLL